MKPGFSVKRMKQRFLLRTMSFNVMVDGCRIKEELSLSLFGFKRVHDCVRIWKGGDWAELAFAKTSGIVTGWDALVSYWLVFFPVPGNSPRRLCDS